MGAGGVGFGYSVFALYAYSQFLVRLLTIHPL
ncbi:MAG: hypothetical protein JWN01_1197 [Patescibacteria group bacterium]|nr:hypothetical protein [Patescibacteria group bacterium]